MDQVVAEPVAKDNSTEQGDNTSVTAQRCWYVGYKPTQALIDSEETFIDNIRDQVEESQSQNLNILLNHVVEDTLNAFFVQPIEFVGLNDTAKKVVLKGVSTIKKAVVVVIKQISSKLSNEEMVDFAEYLDGCLHRPSDLNGQRHVVAVPVTDELRNTLVSSFEKGRAGDPQSVTQELQDGLIEISNAVTAAFFDKPIQLLRLNFVMRKLAQGSCEAVKKATAWVIKNAFKGIKDPEIIAAIDYMEAIIVRGPIHDLEG